ncbi:acyl carrier protein [Streptomyces sp. NBC_00459]|uniref:acyl carrier protein n=1 Tax=Streptomyces sp. NBC_00459 TaxID=2975749 RepID=UPI002E172867
MTQTSVGFVVDYLLSKRPDVKEIDLDLDLIENRILDSLGFVNFLYVLEEHTGQEISLESVTPEDFRTVRSITQRFFDGPADLG